MHAQVWKDALTRKQQSPYMRHTLGGGIMRDLSFCPYEARSHTLITPLWCDCPKLAPLKNPSWHRHLARVCMLEDGSVFFCMI